MRKLSSTCIAFLALLTFPLPAMAMPAAVVSFLAMGHTNTPSVVVGTPPDPNGAVGPNHYVEMVNSGIEIFNKTGGVVQAAKSLKTLWTGYSGFNAGNACATRNDGDPMVRYDRLADRWIITQMSLPNVGSNTGPSYQCVAVSKTGDPTGAYWLYDFKSLAWAAGPPSIGVWPDAYYFTHAQFGSGAQPYQGVEVCAWNRAAMLSGQTETTGTEQCFMEPNTYYGLVPADLDGSVPPPPGSPEYVVAEDPAPNTLDVWTFHVDWTVPANSTFTGPTLLTTAAFTDACATACIPQFGSPQLLDSLSAQLMDRAAYRNFGTHESLVVNQTVNSSGPTALRWYELRLAGGTASIYQQGTYNPPDTKYRWLGSIAQDAAGDMALGFSESSSSTRPAVAWVGRLSTDPLGTMPQPESVIVQGIGSQTLTSRWGDYSSMQVDPSDDCTFWFANEFYSTSGSNTWETQVAAVKFPACRQNDFSISASPTPVSVAKGATGSTTISTTLTRGSAETLTLTASGLPSGTTASFNPGSITSGQGSTLTLNVGSSTPSGSYPILVTATGPSAYHSTTVTLVVTTAPIVSSINPGAGPAPGGTSVTLTGIRFTGATGVTFGTTAAATFQVVSDTSITAVSPAGAGAVDITVTTAAGTSGQSTGDRFTYLPAKAILPVMANAAYGGYTTVAEIQNVGGGPANIAIQYTDSNGSVVGSGDVVAALGTNATWTVRQDNGHSFASGGAGSARVYSDQPVATFVNEFAPGGGDATSYSGINVTSGTGTTLFAPAIANNAYGGYTTGIGLINMATSPATISVAYRDTSGTVVKTQTLPNVAAGAYQGLYSGDATLGLPNQFAGTATITSSAGNLAAVVNETGPGGQFSSYDAVPAGSTTLFAPVALNSAYGGYNTGMGVQNTTGTAGIVTVKYFDATGTATTKAFSIPANGYLGIYQGSPTDGPAPGAYTASITSTVAVAAIVNEVAPSNTVAKQSTAYNTFGAGAGTLHLPLVESSGSDGWSTGEGIMNTGPAATTVTVTYYDANTGLQVGTPDVTTLQPNAFWGLYQPAGGLPNGSRASAVITTTSAGQVAVVCNESSATSFMSYDGQ